MANVTRIETVREVTSKRVAAYCRVSTDKDAQLYSLENQMKAFQAKIILHPEMELVGIYADEDKSGTSMKGRVEFQRMLDDCKAGKVDYILTKREPVCSQHGGHSHNCSRSGGAWHSRIL